MPIWHIFKGDAAIPSQTVRPSSSSNREREKGAIATLNDGPTLSTCIISKSPSYIITKLTRLEAFVCQFQRYLEKKKIEKFMIHEQNK